MSRATQFKSSLWRILWALAGYPASSTSDIRARTGIQGDQILTTLKRLERTGIVARSRRFDGVVTWNLTEAGNDVLREFGRNFAAATERMDRHDR